MIGIWPESGVNMELVFFAIVVIVTIVAIVAIVTIIVLSLLLGHLIIPGIESKHKRSHFLLFLLL